MKINIRENIYGLDIEDLISVGYRVNNDKRNFLFISKLLGKHIEVKPDICKATGFLLALGPFLLGTVHHYIHFTFLSFILSSPL